jgi:hypothetical protein
VVVEGEPVASPYSGPMSLPVDHGDEASVLARSGAAGRAVECDGDPYNGGGADYDSGLASVQDSAEESLENFLTEEGWESQLPSEGYRVEREDDGRALLSYDVDGRTKVAFIAADGVRDYDDDRGWGVESWAQCDPAELPADVTEALGIGVWQDAAGRRVPETQIGSFQGPEHCDWQDITFLRVGAGREADEYLRDTKGELADLLRTTYDAHAALPDGATDTGFHRDGRQLWLGPAEEAAYLVSRADPRDVERWPATKEQIACA